MVFARRPSFLYAIDYQIEVWKTMRSSQNPLQTLIEKVMDDVKTERDKNRRKCYDPRRYFWWCLSFSAFFCTLFIITLVFIGCQALTVVHESFMISLKETLEDVPFSLPRDLNSTLFEKLRRQNEIFSPWSFVDLTRTCITLAIWLGTYIIIHAFFYLISSQPSEWHVAIEFCRQYYPKMKDNDDFDIEMIEEYRRKVHSSFFSTEMAEVIVKHNMKAVMRSAQVAPA